MMSENTSVKELADTLRTVAFAAERGNAMVELKPELAHKIADVLCMTSLPAQGGKTVEELMRDVEQLGKWTMGKMQSMEDWQQRQAKRLDDFMDLHSRSLFLFEQSKIKHQLMCGLFAMWADPKSDPTYKEMWNAAEFVYAEGVARGIYPKEGA